MSSFTRREFGKLVASAAGAVTASPLLTLTPGTAEAYNSGYITRSKGPVLTNASMAQLRDCMARGGYDMKKVVTPWGMVGGWTQANMTDVCHHTAGTTVVRTHRGDGCRTDAGYQWAYSDPNAIEAEIRPWYNTHNYIWIELGNEPNNQCWTLAGRNNDNYIWEWRYVLDQAIARCRAAFPRATLVSPGLATDTSSDKNAVQAELDKWCAIAGDVMRKCDYIGFHVYGYYSFKGGDGTLSSVQPVLSKYFNDKPWLITEYGINDTGNTNDASKGTQYAEFIHFNGSAPVLSSNCRGALYYHLCMSGGEQAYQIYDGNGDNAYKTRTG
jgi:hypothetical protein